MTVLFYASNEATNCFYKKYPMLSFDVAFCAYPKTCYTYVHTSNLHVTLSEKYKVSLSRCNVVLIKKRCCKDNASYHRIYDSSTSIDHCRCIQVAASRLPGNACLGNNAGLATLVLN